MIRFADTTPRFEPGDLVTHRRYGYRGVVVAVDERCSAGDQWYLGNRTQPNQNQPWYHVLVHGQGATTYAAESNLAADATPSPVDHPLVDQFFSGFCSGQYVRNEAPWPGW